MKAAKVTTVKFGDGLTKVDSISSAQPGYKFYGLFGNSGRVTTSGAERDSNTPVVVHVSGYILQK